MSIDDTQLVEALAKWFGLVLTVLLLVEAIRRVIVVPILRVLHNLEELLEDWRGQDARPGVAEVPGVMKQLADLKTTAKRSEYHLGNGHEPALRVLVMTNAAAVQEAKETAAQVGKDLHRHIESLADDKRHRADDFPCLPDGQDQETDQKAGPS